MPQIYEIHANDKPAKIADYGHISSTRQYINGYRYISQSAADDALKELKQRHPAIVFTVKSRFAYIVGFCNDDFAASL